MERPGIPPDTPRFHTTCADCRVEAGPIPRAALEIAPDPWPLHVEPLEIALETAGRTTCTSDSWRLSIDEVSRPAARP